MHRRAGLAYSDRAIAEIEARAIARALASQIDPPIPGRTEPTLKRGRIIRFDWADPYAAHAERPKPSMPVLRWLLRPLLPLSERERTGKAPKGLGGEAKRR
jgi:hypothetical protein